MPTGVSSKNPELRSAIIVAARDLFLSRSFEKTSMTDIGNAVSVSKPTVYEHFDSKEEVIAAVVEAAFNDLDLELIRSASTGEITFQEYLRRLPDEYMQMIGCRARSAIHRLLAQQGTRLPSLARGITSRISVKMSQAYQELFTRVMNSGECKRLDHDVATRIFTSPMNTVMLQIAIEGEEAFSHERTRAFFEIYFSMVAQYLLPKPM